jgi:hypothetical protein
MGFIVLGTTMFFFMACNSCKTEPILIYASKDLTAVGAFKPGTIWVYQNDSTFEQDSVIVTDYQYLPDTVTGECKQKAVIANYKEAIYTYATSLFFNENFKWTVKVGQPVLLSKDTLPADTIFIDAACTDTSFCSVIDTLVLNGISYVNVYERIDSSSSLEDGKLTHYYSLPFYGIIKKEIFNADSTIESWSLVYSQIVQ